MNPTAWTDPDEVGSSEYRAIHEHAMEVWNSNPNEDDDEREQYVRASLEEMQGYIASLISESDKRVK